MAAVALLGVAVLGWLPAEPATMPDTGSPDPSLAPNPLQPPTPRRVP
jgi:hypothetical protein